MLLFLCSTPYIDREGKKYKIKKEKNGLCTLLLITTGNFRDRQKIRKKNTSPVLSHRIVSRSHEGTKRSQATAERPSKSAPSCHHHSWPFEEFRGHSSSLGATIRRHTSTLGSTSHASCEVAPNRFEPRSIIHVSQTAAIAKGFEQCAFSARGSRMRSCPFVFLCIFASELTTSPPLQPTTSQGLCASHMSCTTKYSLSRGRRQIHVVLLDPSVSSPAP